MRFYNGAVDQIQTIARLGRQPMEYALPDAAAGPTVELEFEASIRMQLVAPAEVHGRCHVRPPEARDANPSVAILVSPDKVLEVREDA